ncbi:MAG: hypothetical protein V1492_02530 [Candidatus Micrarchaeota archaeon]
MDDTYHQEAIKEIKKEITELHFDEAFVSWLKSQIEKMESDLDNYSGHQKQFYLFSSIRGMLTRIKQEKPRDPKTFVLKELKRQNYVDEIEKIIADIQKSSDTDTPRLNRFEKQISGLEKRVKKDDPEYFEKEKPRFAAAIIILNNKRQGRKAMV